MVNVVGYARVSTDKEEQALSFSAQQKFFKQYCIEKNYNLINIYADEGISGTSTKNRPELLAMLKQAADYFDVPKSAIEYHIYDKRKRKEFEANGLKLYTKQEILNLDSPSLEKIPNRGMLLKKKY